MYIENIKNQKLDLYQPTLFSKTQNNVNKLTNQKEINKNQNRNFDLLFLTYHYCPLRKV